jgi:hypothetical protein
MPSTASNLGQLRLDSVHRSGEPENGLGAFIFLHGNLSVAEGNVPRPLELV